VADANDNGPATALAALRRLGLAGEDETPAFTPLTGGVASDIWRVDLSSGSICVKRALEQLRVAVRWQAPVERNLYEARWMRCAAAIVPEAVSPLLGQDRRTGVLAMAYLPPEEYTVWKSALGAGAADPEVAAAVAERLVRIHAATAHKPEVAAQFPSTQIFCDIRLEPYLIATARVHRDRARALRELVEETSRHRLALVHGDVSPKNILVGPRGPVLVDAECACYGDPAFDLAFCLNHLLLKCLLCPSATSALLQCFDVLESVYLERVSWEQAAGLERRAARLVPGLLLARVDGKSPVEYLTQDAHKEIVRRIGRALLADTVDKLGDVRAAWGDAVSAS
jgi:aminoglycoside phosphotransferase (APT) family kinase protein